MTDAPQDPAAEIDRALDALEARVEQIERWAGRRRELSPHPPERPAIVVDTIEKIAADLEDEDPEDFADSDIETYAARIRALAPPEASPWRPIETAPLDGRRIIAVTKGGGIVFIRFGWINYSRHLHGNVDKAWWVESGDAPPHWLGNAMTNDGENPPVKWVPWPS